MTDEDEGVLSEGEIDGEDDEEALLEGLGSDESDSGDAEESY